MNVSHLRHAAIVVPDHDRSLAFFTDSWGLQVVARDDGATYLRTQRAEPFQLALLRGEKRQLGRIAFALRSRAAVDRAAQELGERGIAIEARPHELSSPGGGYGLRFRDPDGRCIEISADVRGEATEARGATPLYLAHVVLNTPDIDRATAFYTEVLGLRISDWSEHIMSFLRCDREHHAIALNAAPHASLNHTSWQMGSIDELFRGQGRVRAAGTPLSWGTGRHAPGKQVFNYFVEPSGFVVEYIADGEPIEDGASWKPQVYGRTPAAMDIWNTSGPPSEAIRAAMLGEPEPAARA